MPRAPSSGPDPRAARLLGARPATGFLSLVAPGSEEKARCFLELACAGETGSCELVLVADGRPVAMAWRGAPTAVGAVLVGSLVPEEFQSVQQEVTATMGELALLQRETARQRRHLADANVEIQQLLVAERAARGQAEVERARWQQDLVTIEETATRMAAMLDDLLDLTHLQMGRPLELRRQPTDLVGLARRVAEANQQLSDAHTLRVRSGFPTLEGLWDQARLERVIGNLVANAVKYSPRGGEVTLDLAREETTDGSCAVLSVQDQGVGIPPEALPHVFERFYRASNVVGQIAGTGRGPAGGLRRQWTAGGRPRQPPPAGVGRAGRDPAAAER